MHPRRPSSEFGLSTSHHALPVLILTGLSVLYWSKVLFTGQVLLPGAMLRGFAPFGSQLQAPWNILQWDALGQYYPWRTFAAGQLRHGLIPLWNPYQFSGTPFVANGQSAVFYPFNLPFWIMDVAYAFGVSALLHTLLATLSTYFLTRRWQFSRSAGLFAAIAFGFCGYLSAWIMLPTLANTAAWLPLLLLCLEWSTEPHSPSQRPGPFLIHALPLILALGCALLAGHPQVFFYLLFALLLRAFFLPQKIRALSLLLLSGVCCLTLGALQVLPTLELARLGHRTSQGGPSWSGWQAIAARALQPGELLSLFVPGWPLQWGSVSENFGYVGVTVTLLAGAAIGRIILLKYARQAPPEPPPAGDNAALPTRHNFYYALLLAFFGLLYGMATTVALPFYFGVPGVAQMGGPGRALLLWSFGIALLGGFGVDALRRWWKSDLVTPLALAALTLELFAAGWTLHPIAPRAAIYPQTSLTTWLQDQTRDGSRILFLTPRSTWQPVELLQAMQPPRNHPAGVLPPNGAMVYGLHDINGYDSLAPRAYRQFVTGGEGNEVSPQWNGNMILLNNTGSSILDELNVRYVVSEEPREIAGGREVFSANGAYVYERTVQNAPRRHGSDFYPGWRNGRYQPASFRFGTFLTLATLTVIRLVMAYSWAEQKSRKKVNTEKRSEHQEKVPGEQQLDTSPLAGEDGRGGQ